MNFDRAAQPLGVVLRTAFAGLIVGALAVNLLFVSRIEPARTWTPATLGVAAFGLAWVRWPRTFAWCAVGAATCSIWLTREAPGLRFDAPAFTEFAVLPALYAAVLRAPARYWPLAAYVAAAGLLLGERWGSPDFRWVVRLGMLVLFGAATSAVVYMRLRDNERAVSVERAREAERLALARELHDVVGHHVTGMVVLAQARRFADSARGPVDPAHDATLAEIEQAGLQTMSSIRRLVGLLRDDAATSDPALDDLERVVDDLRRTHPQARLEVDHAIRERWVPAELAATVLRLVQELATNVRKHGDPSWPAVIELCRDRAVIELRAQNRSLGGARASGYGLVGMRERVEALRGSFVSGLDGDGLWSVRLQLPLVSARAEAP